MFLINGEMKERFCCCFHCNIIALLMAACCAVKEKADREKGKKGNVVN